MSEKPEEATMTKDGMVRPGHTPSAVSGLPSQLIKRGEALRRGEACPEMGEGDLPFDLPGGEDE